MNEANEEQTWVIQWRIDAKTHNYEDWPGYSETPMTRNEMLSALEECHSKWPHYEFRGHNVHAALLRHRVDESIGATKKE
ncbi:hypothetical protein J2N86_16015 (plasmid) [Legionella lytica]|uniref:MbtH-like protein n=1 Tax=Legionella lytica TaxID=96232 RepID=A0ABY4YE56_9GAMM|nr:hypothetical protein [Legionella lytica]USQ15530.1 hypothetical protein J2N86_16015 [Legionella lytica]